MHIFFIRWSHSAPLTLPFNRYDWMVLGFFMQNINFVILFNFLSQPLGILIDALIKVCNVMGFHFKLEHHETFCLVLCLSGQKPLEIWCAKNVTPLWPRKAQNNVFCSGVVKCPIASNTTVHYYNCTYSCTRVKCYNILFIFLVML